MWSQFLGKSIDGELAGTVLELLPSRGTTWSLWRADYPHGSVMDKGGVGIIDSRSFIFEAEAAEVVGEPTAEGLSIYDLLLGLAFGDARVAFAMKDLVEDRVRNEVVDGTPLLIAASAGTYTGAAYQRTLDGDTLTFAVALHVGSRQRRGDRRRT